MFLNLSPPDDGTVFNVCPFGSMMVDGVCIGDPSTYGPKVLIDQNVNYYGFLESKEYSDWMASIKGEIRTADTYESPYFGFQSSGAYSELDRIYEAYKSNLPITTMPVEYPNLNDQCSPEYPVYSDAFKNCIGFTDKGIKIQPKTTSPGINPALLLAVAAAFFFAG